MARGLIVFGVVAAAGCNSGECVGTLRYGNTCVAVDPFDKTPPTIVVDPPQFTRQVGTASLTTDEPATIYYTVDGTPPTLDSPSGPDQVVLTDVADDAQLRFFAVDLNGNRSAEQVWLWVIDREGPAAPLDFKLTLTGDDRALAWTPAPDPRPGGVLVARIDGRLSKPPEGGKVYAVGDTIGPGVEVVAVSTDPAGAFHETAPVKPGLVRYMAWGFDDLHNYGAPAGDYVVVPLPQQTAQVSVATNGTVNVTSQPSALAIVGSAQASGSTLTVKLNLRNDSSRVLFAPKVVLSSALPGGASWRDPTGTLAGKPYRAYGGAIAPGATTVATWIFDGVPAGGLQLTLDILDNRVLSATVQDRQTKSGGQVVDEVTGARLVDLAQGALGDGGNSGTYSIAYTPDARIVAGGRNAGAVTSYDAITGQRLAQITLRPEKAHVPQLIVDRSGSAVYAIVANGHPNRVGSGSGTDSELVRLDAANLALSGRLPLGTSKNKSLEISPDGKSLLISTGITAQGVIVVDLTTFTIKTRIKPAFRPQVATFAADGASIAVVGEQLQLFGLGGEPGAMFATPDASGGKVVRAAFPTKDAVWIGRGRGALSKVDLATGNPTTFTAYAGQLVEVFDGKLYARSKTVPDTVNIVDMDGTATATLPGFFRLRGHHIARSPF